ncbi:hypothetical protein HA42_19280 [Pantoea deleyi]|nr:hypothetical protein HA42_19280 [Pantoea deleyi]
MMQQNCAEGSDFINVSAQTVPQAGSAALAGMRHPKQVTAATVGLIRQPLPCPRKPLKLADNSVSAAQCARCHLLRLP